MPLSKLIWSEVVFLKSLIGTICLHFHLLRMISIFVIGGCLVVSISWLGVLQRFRDQDSN